MMVRFTRPFGLLAMIGFASILACSHTQDHRAVTDSSMTGSKSIAGIVPDDLAGETGLKLAESGSSSGPPLSRGVGGTLEVGDRRLPDGSHFDSFSFTARAGNVVELSMRSTDTDFVPYLIVAGTEEMQVVARAGGRDARPALLLFEVPTTGQYHIFASSVSANEYGRYELEFSLYTSDRPRPPADLAAAYPGGGPPGERYAVLVGIDDYPGVRHDLASCNTDTRLMREILIQRFGYRPENVIVINDSAATRGHIIAAIRRHLGQAGPDGSALFFYSGHGARTRDQERGDEPDGWDEALSVWDDDLYHTLIIDDEINILLGQLSSETKVVILDSCHAGTGTLGADFKFVSLDDPVVKSRLRLPADLTRGDRDADRHGGLDHILLASCRADETSLASQRGMPSVFTMAFKAELEVSSPDVSVSEFIEGVSRRVRTEIEVVRMLDHSQTPQVEGQTGGLTLGRALSGDRREPE